MVRYEDRWWRFAVSLLCAVAPLEEPPPSPSKSPLSVSSRNPLPAPREAHSSLPASYGEEAGGVTWCRAPLHPAERLRSAN